MRFAGDSDDDNYPGYIGRASSNNTVENNVITFNSDYNVGSRYPDPDHVGVGNVARHNCVFGGGANFYNPPAFAPGYVQYDNILQNPLYTDQPAHNYTLLPGSPCQSLGAGIG